MVYRTAVISFTGTGDNTVIAAVTGVPIKVYAFVFTVTGATNITIKDTAGNSYSGAFIFTGNGSSMTLPIVGSAWYQCDVGDGFVLNQSGAVQVSGTVWYALG